MAGGIKWVLQRWYFWTMVSVARHPVSSDPSVCGRRHVCADSWYLSVCESRAKNVSAGVGCTRASGYGPSIISAVDQYRHRCCSPQCGGKCLRSRVLVSSLADTWTHSITQAWTGDALITEDDPSLHTAADADGFLKGTSSFDLSVLP